MKKQKGEAERFTLLQQPGKKLQTRLYLLRLLSTEREIASHKAEQRQLEGKYSDSIRGREEITHIEKRKAMTARSLDKAKEGHRKNEKYVALLEKEIEEIPRETHVPETENAEAEEAHGELALGRKQREEYNKPKDQVGTKTASLREEISSKERAFMLVPVKESVRRAAMLKARELGTAYNNLSAVHIKQKNWEQAMASAKAALEIESANLKAPSRKGMACQHLGLLEEAKSDLVTVCKRDAAHKEARTALETVVAAMKAGKKKVSMKRCLGKVAELKAQGHEAFKARDLNARKLGASTGTKDGLSKTLAGQELHREDKERAQHEFEKGVLEEETVYAKYLGQNRAKNAAKGDRGEEKSKENVEVGRKSQDDGELEEVDSERENVEAFKRQHRRSAT